MGFLPTAASRHKCLQNHPKIQRQNTVFSTSSTSASFIPRFLPALSSLACLTMCSTSWKLMKFATWRSQIHQTEADLDFTMERKNQLLIELGKVKLFVPQWSCSYINLAAEKPNKLQPNKMTTRLFVVDRKLCPRKSVMCRLLPRFFRLLWPSQSIGLGKMLKLLDVFFQPGTSMILV